MPMWVKQLRTLPCEQGLAAAHVACIVAVRSGQGGAPPRLPLPQQTVLSLQWPPERPTHAVHVFSRYPFPNLCLSFPDPCPP